MQVERLDKGMVAIDPVSPVKHARLMPLVFPELAEAAAADMGAPVPVGPRPLLALDTHAAEAVDRDYDNWKYFLKKRSY
jgi:hypothetical protein